MKRILLLAVLALGCSKKDKTDKPPGGEGGGQVTPGGEGGEYGCAIAIAPAVPMPPGSDADLPVFQGEGHSMNEEEAHRLAEEDACKKAGAPPDCVKSGQYVKKSGTVTRTEKK